MRRKIVDWELDKKVKSTEMKFIAKKRQRRRAQGKSTSFRVRGQAVRDDKIDRWMKRKGANSPPISPYPGNSPVPSTPTMSVISYNTISEMGSPIPHSIVASVAQLSGTQWMRENHQKLPMSSPVSSNQRLSTIRDFKGINGYEEVDGSQFGGQSPAPFTAPSTPTLSHQETLRIEFPSHYHSSEPVSKHVWSDKASMEAPPLMSRKTRYLEKEESDLRHRLDEFLSRFGTHHPAYLDTLDRLVVVLLEQGRYQAAETACKELIENSRNAFGDDDFRTLITEGRLADILQFQGRNKTSLALLRKIDDKASTMLPKSHLALLNIKESLANSLVESGNYTEAELLFRDCIRTRASGRAVDDEFLLTAMSNLALVLRNLGRLAESEKILREVLTANTLSATPQHYILRATCKLSLVLIDLSKYHEAGLKMREVCNQQRTLLGAEHPETLTSQMVLVLALRGQNLFDEAETLARDTIQKMCRVLGSHHPITATAQNDLIQVLSGLGRYTEGEILAKQQILLCEKYLGPNDIRTIDCIRILGQLYGEQARFEEALKMLRTALKNSTEHFGTEHPITKLCSANFTWILEKKAQAEAIGAVPNVVELEAMQNMVWT